VSGRGLPSAAASRILVICQRREGGREERVLMYKDGDII